MKHGSFGSASCQVPVTDANELFMSPMLSGEIYLALLRRLNRLNHTHATCNALLAEASSPHLILLAHMHVWLTRLLLVRQRQTRCATRETIAAARDLQGLEKRACFARNPVCERSSAAVCLGIKERYENHCANHGYPPLSLRRLGHVNVFPCVYVTCPGLLWNALCLRDCHWGPSSMVRPLIPRDSDQYLHNSLRHPFHYFLFNRI